MRIIRISATWCTSCIVTYPVWTAIQEKYPNFTYEELDYDMDDIKSYQVGDILPVMIIMKDQEELARIVGEKKIEEITKVIEECI